MKALQHFKITNPVDKSRENALVEKNFQIRASEFPKDFSGDSRLLYAQVGKGGRWAAVPSQVSDLVLKDGHWNGRLSIRLDLAAGEALEMQLLLAVDESEVPEVNKRSPISMTKGTEGPQHRFIENDYYKVETLPTSGQIWHFWNKVGANEAWHHHEWVDNRDKGGDPCHWAPNCWIAYPDRITNGYELLDGREIDLIDWHYVFGWYDPETEIIEGPVYTEIRRRGVVWPHPEHSRPEIERDSKPRLWAEVIYRFFPDSPCVYQSSRMELLEPVNVFFIRNCQFVFFYNAFTHLYIMPERDGLKPGDDPLPACFKLMGEVNQRPYDQMQHSLANIIPPKLDHYAFFNSRTKDGFALFQLVENNYNKERGGPTYHNHSTILTEVYEWSTYLSRTFSYSNDRFAPEMVNPLPRGEVYEESNVLYPFRYEGVDGMEKLLREQSDTLNGRILVEPVNG